MLQLIQWMKYQDNSRAHTLTFHAQVESIGDFRGEIYLPLHILEV